MKHPTKDHSLFCIDIIKELVEDYMQLGTKAESASRGLLPYLDNQDKTRTIEIRTGQLSLQTTSKPSPPPSPSAELKPLPAHLKYLEQEQKLLQVLIKHKKAIRWTLADLLGIKPSICMHKLLLEEEARPIRQQ
ncbi:hypothetical protein CR513_03038, partial [Mucuna pruriens]